MLKKFLIALVIIVAIVLTGYGVYRYDIDRTESRNDEEFLNKIKESISKENEKKIIITGDTVNIKNGVIENEGLIDKFIEEAVETNPEELKLDIVQDKNTIQVYYIPGEYALATVNNDEIKKQELVDLAAQDSSPENLRKIYGEYKVIINDNLQYDFWVNSFTMKKETRYNQVIVYFDSETVDMSVFPLVCKYKLDIGEHSVNLFINFTSNKELGITDIYTDNNQSVKTMNGDVDIVINSSKVFKLQEGLENQEFTIADIVNECSSDSFWNYKDKGFKNEYTHRNKVDIEALSQEETFKIDDFYTEYYYEDYTVLYIVKGTERTLVIGPKGKLYDTYMKNVEGIL